MAKTDDLYHVVTGISTSLAEFSVRLSFLLTEFGESLYFTVRFSITWRLFMEIYTYVAKY